MIGYKKKLNHFFNLVELRQKVHVRESCRFSCALEVLLLESVSYIETPELGTLAWSHTQVLFPHSAGTQTTLKLIFVFFSNHYFCSRFVSKLS